MLEQSKPRISKVRFWQKDRFVFQILDLDCPININETNAELAFNVFSFQATALSGCETFTS